MFSQVSVNLLTRGRVSLIPCSFWGVRVCLVPCYPMYLGVGYPGVGYLRGRVSGDRVSGDRVSGGVGYTPRYPPTPHPRLQKRILLEWFLVSCRGGKSFKIFANIKTLTMLTLLTYLLCFNLGEIISCVWDTSVY